MRVHDISSRQEVSNPLTPKTPSSRSPNLCFQQHTGFVFQFFNDVKKNQQGAAAQFKHNAGSQCQIREPVMLSPPLVILIPLWREKDLGSSLRVNSAKHLGSFLTGARQMRGFFAPLRFAQNDKPYWIAHGLMTLSLARVGVVMTT